MPSIFLMKSDLDYKTESLRQIRPLKSLLENCYLVVELLLRTHRVLAADP